MFRESDPASQNTGVRRAGPIVLCPLYRFAPDLRILTCVSPQQCFPGSPDWHDSGYVEILSKISPLAVHQLNASGKSTAGDATRSRGNWAGDWRLWQPLVRPQTYEHKQGDGL